MLVEIPKGQYLKGVRTLHQGVEVEFGSPKKVAILFICLNPHYWPYIGQVIKNCRQHFLKNHKIDFFVWTDFGEESKKKELSQLEALKENYYKATDKTAALGEFLNHFTQIVRLYEHFYPQQLAAAFQQLTANGIFFKREGSKFWLESARATFTDQDFEQIFAIANNTLLTSHADLDETLKDVHLIETDSVPWPSPTLMRYHLFLNEEEKLKDYDYLFYMDADMKVVEEVGDEILGPQLTAAPHPGYEVMPILIPPYEPNQESSAYIPRLGRVVQENGKNRFYPFYAAGGFQGGTAKDFIEAMQHMKSNIDKDFNKNYIAIWNDESHWNKYLWKFQQDKGHITFLDPSYVYPDSLIEDYYVKKVWGRNYPPKIITLTKPFSLSAEGAQALKEITK